MKAVMQFKGSGTILVLMKFGEIPRKIRKNYLSKWILLLFMVFKKPHVKPE